MREVDDASVTLTVTSPPYYNAMDYTKFKAGTSAHKARTYSEGFGSYDEYLALMTRCFSEVYRVTKPGGHCALVVGTIITSGRAIPLAHDLSTRLQQLGWEFLQEVVWYKAASSLDRAGTLVLHPYPGYWYSNCLHELVLIMRKPGPKLYRQATDVQREASRIPISPLVTADVLKDVWTIPVVTYGTVDHPCPFPTELAHRLVLLYSYTGDLILDPFAGSGTTGQVALATGRHFVGYELQEQFAALARRRIAEPLRLRRRQLIIRHEHLTDDPFVRPFSDVA